MTRRLASSTKPEDAAEPVGARGAQRIGVASVKGKREIWKAVALATAMSLGTQAQSETAGTPAAPTYITYTEDAPCPPEAAGQHLHRRRVLHRARVHVRRPRHVLVKAAVTRPTVHRKRPTVMRVRKRVERPAPLHLVNAAVPVHHKRCSVVRRDRLTSAAFGIAPRDALIAPVSYDIAPAGAVTDATSANGPAAFGDPIGGAAGGSGRAGGAGGGLGGTATTTPVSAAPEPDAWALMISGVAVAGFALRRRRRTASARA